VIGEKGALRPAEKSAYRLLTSEHLQRQGVVHFCLHRPGADEAARHRVDLDSEAR
jgi:hypothetical protein